MELAIFKFPENGKWTRERVDVASFLDMNKHVSDYQPFITIVSPDGNTVTYPDEDFLLAGTIHVIDFGKDTTLLTIAEKLFDIAVTVDG